MVTLTRHLIVYLLVLLLGPLCAWARPTTEAEARRSVAGWLAMDPRPLKARMGAKPTQVKAFKDSAGNIDYFVVNLDAGGFAVVAGDDLLEPIIAFTAQGTFDPNPQNPLYALLNRDVPVRLAEVRQKENQARALKRKFIPQGLHRRAQSKWVRLLAADTVPSPPVSSLPSVSDLRVEPLVLTRWGQDYEGTLCYNYYTPYNYPSGCVATAMAQLMYYHTWPTGPVDPPPFDRYTIYVNGAPTPAWLQGGDGNGGPYNWGSMVLDPNVNTGDTERQAIGALTHDTGVAVQTSYALSGSGAYNSNVLTALTNTFGFSNARYAYDGSYYSIPIANLNNMINPNLDARFPVLLGIIDPNVTGHEVIVDGYGYNSSTLYHHLNLGWTGIADAWYNLPTVSAGSYNFISAIQCIYNVFPVGAGEIISGRVLDTSGNPVSGATITATPQAGGGPFTATSNSQGIYALAKIPVASTYTITASMGNYVFFPQTVSTGTSVNGNTATGNLWGIDFVHNSPGITLNQALDNNSLAFTTGGDRSWSGQTAVSFYAGSSAQSGALSGSQSAWLQTTVVGPGTLSFHWKVSSEADCDFLEVFVDNVLQPEGISGEVAWQPRNISIPAGSHIIKWFYSKDAFVGLGSDCGWVDKVSFVKGSMTPILKLLLLDD